MRSARLGSIDSVGSDVGMSRSTSRREEMEAWLAFRETEGLTYRELAEESGINVNTLAYWLRDCAGRQISRAPGRSPGVRGSWNWW